MKIYYIFFIFLFTGCSKLGDDLRFNNYTHTNNTGTQIGGNGKDWKFNEEFNNKVNALFNSTKGEICDFEMNNFIIGYPNPTSNSLNVYWEGINAQNNYDFAEFILVDKKLNILLSGEISDLSNNIITFSVSNLDVKRARLFYKFYKNDCELRGYGNIFIN